MLSTRRVLAVAFTALCLVSSACSGEKGSLSDASAWSVNRISANEVEGFQSFAEMADASSAVVLGVVTQISEPIEIKGDAVDDTLMLVSYEVEPSWSSGLQSDVEKISLLMTAANGPEDFSSWFGRLKANKPKGKVLVFLREVKEMPGTFRLVNSTGLWVQESGRVVAPLAEDGDIPYAKETSGKGDISSLVEVVKAIRK